MPAADCANTAADPDTIDAASTAVTQRRRDMAAVYPATDGRHAHAATASVFTFLYRGRKSRIYCADIGPMETGPFGDGLL